MSDEVKINVPEVSVMSRDFNQIGNTLNQVNRKLNECVEILNQTAYTGRVGGKAVRRFIEELQPTIMDLSEKSFEISDDLGQSIQAYERGDELGATRFY